MAQKVQSVLSALFPESLIKIAHSQGVEVEKDAPKERLVAKLTTQVQTMGLKILFENLKKEEMETLGTSLDIKKEKDIWTRAIAQGRLMEVLRKKEMADELSKLNDASLKILQRVIAEDEDEEPAKFNKNEVVKETVQWIYRVGLEALLSHFDVTFLVRCLADMNIKTSEKAKLKLIEAIVERKAPKVDKSAKKGPPEFSAKKLPLKKGLTFQDIFQHYTVVELVEYLKEHNLKYTGTKNDLIRRILKHLNGETDGKDKGKAKETKKKQKEEKKGKEEKEKEEEGKEAEEKNVDEVETEGEGKSPKKRKAPTSPKKSPPSKVSKTKQSPAKGKGKK